jgi:membrane-bound lytic murein transglycosylase D
VKLWVFSLVIALWVTGCATNPESGIALAPSAFNTQITPLPAPLETKVETKPKEIVQAKDLWDRLRSGFEIPDPDEEIIDKQVRQLLESPEGVQLVLDRSSYYLFYIIEEVEARDLPSELALLPFVESAFNPKAISPAKAAGMWQFMPATGKSYKLKQNMFLDERADVVKSTRAALEYLQKLYEQFGHWHLALAAYNWGEGSLGKALLKNQKANLGNDFFSLNLPKETKNYVPRLLAYKRIIESPEKYGIKLPVVPNHPYFVEVPVLKDIDKEKAIELSEISEEQFLALNPSFTKPVILKELNPTILLPYGKAELFKYNLTHHPKPLSKWTAVKIHKTESVEKIAKAVEVKPSDIRLVNNIPPGMKVRSGSSLLIPKKENHHADVDPEIAQNGILLLEKEFNPVPVSMKCREKKCTAAPSKLSNYEVSDKKSSSTSKTSSKARQKKTTTADLQKSSTSQKKKDNIKESKKN